MVMRSREFSYEVIQVLAEPSHYLCRRAGDAGNSRWLLVSLEREALGTEGIPYILELAENPGFTDLNEYFWLDESMILVFAYPDGKALTERLAEGDWSMKNRFEAGRKILERFLLLMVPDWMIREVSAPEWIYLTDDGGAGFYYPMKRFLDGQGEEEGDVWNRLAGVFTALFSREGWEEQYPEIKLFLEKAAAGGWPELIDGYQAYLQLLPVCSQERTGEETQKEPLLSGLKALGRKALVVGKVVMGLGVLLAAVVMLPKAWKEQVEPYIEAAALWKAVYVDGETLVQEEEPTEPEPETDPDNGFVTRYWEEGQICYQGNMENGSYEGKGTLYYPNGMMQYQGEFGFGQKEGEGSLYTEEGVLLYEGGFHKDRYAGEGRLYDKTFGVLVYEGGFLAGRYDGEGILFHPMTDYPVYKGGFRLGYYDGEGVEYDSNGNLLYEGSFLLGVYHGAGIYYDGRTGQAMLEGEFRNGMLVMTQDAAQGDGMEADAPDGSSAGAGVQEGAVEDEGTEDSMVEVEKG